MIKSCNIAIYYRLIIYSNIKDALFGQKGSSAWNDDVGVWVNKSFGGQAEGLGSWRQNYKSCINVFLSLVKFIIFFLFLATVVWWNKDL